MKRYISYFKYVFWHKYYVFRASFVVGEISLWQAVIHDWTKFLPREFIAYAHNFFNADGSRRNIRDKTGAYDPNTQPDAFKLAWLSHQRSKHHWQSWISIGNGGKLEPMPIPEKYLREMVADWIGAGMATSGREDPFPWYQANKGNMILHPESRKIIEHILVYLNI